MTLRPLSDEVMNATICDNDSILLEGAYQNQAGTYIDHLSSKYGCDSIVTTYLTVDPTVTNTVYDTICQGDSVYLAGAYQHVSGDYVDVYATSLNCDSTLTTSLYVIPTLTSNEAISICEGDSILLAGAYQHTAGNYDDLYTAITTGCDSVHTTALTIIPKLYESVSEAICNGDSIFVGGAWQHAAGDYVDVLTAVSTGCDSVITTTVSLNQVYNNSDAQTICNGDSAYLGGAWQTTAGQYTDVLSSADGCDSTVVTMLTVNVVDTAVTRPNEVSLQASASGANYQWYDCGQSQIAPGATSSLFEPTANGLYAVIVTENGCSDTSACYAVSKIGIGDGNLEVLEMYPNPTSGMFYLKFSQNMEEIEIGIFNVLGQEVMRISESNTELIAVDILTLAAGEYFLEVRSGDKKSILQIVKE